MFSILSNYSDEIINKVQLDIDLFIKNFVEKSIKGYSPKFPVCPFAKKARLDGESVVQIYSGGDYRKFIIKNLEWLCDHDTYGVMLQVFPPRIRFSPGIFEFIRDTNRWTIPKDFFSLHGRTPNTLSSYPGFFNSSEYFIIGTNKLSKVIPAVDKLFELGYYDAPTWTQEHLETVVYNRLKQYELYK